jgi:hypothetical protein
MKGSSAPSIRRRLDPRRQEPGPNTFDSFPLVFEASSPAGCPASQFSETSPDLVLIAMSRIGESYSNYPTEEFDIVNDHSTVWTVS